MFYAQTVAAIRATLWENRVYSFCLDPEKIDDIRLTKHLGAHTYKMRVGMYLAWMCDQIERFETDSLDNALKASRWIGWIMAMMEETFGWSNVQCREYTRQDVKMGFDNPHQLPVLGIDFGRTICDIGSGHVTTGRAEVDPHFFDWPFVDGAVEQIKSLVSLFGPRSMHIVSKCAPESEEPIKEWLTRKEFWKLTGMKPENIHFCRERHEKNPICCEFGITHFVDDRREVLYSMDNVRIRIALNPRDDDPDEAPFIKPPFRPTVAEQHQRQILVAPDWVKASEFIRISFNLKQTLVVV